MANTDLRECCMVSRIMGSKVFSALDANNWYSKVNIDERNMYGTAFTSQKKYIDSYKSLFVPKVHQVHFIEPWTLHQQLDSCNQRVYI